MTNTASPTNLARTPRPVIDSVDQAHPVPHPPHPPAPPAPPPPEPTIPSIEEWKPMSCTEETHTGADQDGDLRDDSGTFPIDAIPSPVREYIEAVSAHIAGPVVQSAMTAMGMVAIAGGAGVRAINKVCQWETPGNMYLVLSSATGSNKSRAIEEVRKPLSQIQKELVLEWEDEKTKAQCELAVIEPELKRIHRQIEAIQKANGDAGAQKTLIREITARAERLRRVMTQRPCLWTQDFTIEALVDILSRNKERAAVITPEGQRFFQNLAGRNSNGSSDDGAMCSFFSGDAYNKDRRVAGNTSLTRPLVSLMVMIQPDLADEFKTNPEYYNRGLIARILFAESGATMEEISTRPEVPQNLRDQWATLIRTLFNKYYPTTPETPYQINMTLAACEVMRDIYNTEARKAKSGDTDGQELRCRWAEHATRIAVNLHLMLHGDRAHEEPISKKTAEDARRIFDFFAAQQLPMIAARKATLKSTRLEKLTGLFLKTPKLQTTGATERDIRRACGLRDKATGQLFFDEMVKAGHLIEIESGRSDSRRFKCATPASLR